MSLVLIVDDQPAIRELLTTWIRRDGYQTALAADAEAALDEMMVHPADVVLCDLQIPEHGEFRLAATLHERFPDTALVLAPADMPPVISLQPGVVVYLAMPFGREAVLSAVRLAVRWHHMSIAGRPKRGRPDDSIET
jgi:CheY-like chemotaxis protein